MNRITLYIDKENIKSIVQSKDRDLYDDCVRLIRKNIDVHYNFSKEEVKHDQYMQSWFKSVMGHGVDNHNAYSESNDDILPNRPVSLNGFLNGNEDRCGIYLLKDEKSCSRIEYHNCILIGNVGKEIRVLQQLLQIDDSDEVFAKDVKWNIFCPKLPLTDIILCDNYYFKNESIYKQNNNELIRVLSSVPIDFPVNVVIITRSTDISEDLWLPDELDKIRDLVQEASNNDDSTVTIIGIKDEIHDRVLITNYYRINSSAGFQKQNRVKNDIRFEIRSHAKGTNFDTSKKLIDSTYQKALDNSVFCMGDKKSNFLHFK